MKNLSLKRILQEETEVKLPPKNSWDAFEQAYQHIVKARKMMQRTVIMGKAENNRKITALQEKIKNREKKPDGSLYSPLEAWDLQQSSYRWNSKYIGFMKDLQDIEATYLDFLSSRGIGLIGEDDLEEIRLLAVAGKTDG